MSLVIKHVDPNTLNPAAYNPRDITELAFEGLKESIKKFGFVDPIVVNTRTTNIVGGHQRLKAALALELTEVPIVEVDLSVSEEKALNITLNNQKISGHYTDTLADLLLELKTEMSEEDYNALRFNDLENERTWDSDLEKMNNIPPIDSEAPGTIKITCKPLDKDSLLLFIKGKLMETAFEGVHIE